MYTTTLLYATKALWLQIPPITLYPTTLVVRKYFTTLLTTIRYFYYLPLTYLTTLLRRSHRLSLPSGWPSPHSSRVNGRTVNRLTVHHWYFQFYDTLRLTPSTTAYPAPLTPPDKSNIWVPRSLPVTVTSTISVTVPHAYTYSSTKVHGLVVYSSTNIPYTPQL